MEASGSVGSGSVGNVYPVNQYPKTWKVCVEPDLAITDEEGNKFNPTDFVELANEQFASGDAGGSVLIWHQFGILKKLQGLLPKQDVLLLRIGCDFLAARPSLSFSDFCVYQLSDRSWEKLNSHEQPLSGWASLGQNKLATHDSVGVIKIWDLKNKGSYKKLGLKHTEYIQQLIPLDDRWLIRLNGEGRGNQKIGIWDDQNSNDSVVNIDSNSYFYKLLPLEDSKFVSYGSKYKERLGGFIAVPERGACIIWDSLGTKLYQWEADSLFKGSIAQLKSEDLAVASDTSIKFWTLSGENMQVATSSLKALAPSRGESRVNIVPTGDGGLVYCYAQGDRFDRHSVDGGRNPFHAALKVLYHSGHVIEIMHTLIEPTFIIRLESGGFAAFYGTTICVWRDPPAIRFIRDVNSLA